MSSSGGIGSTLTGGIQDIAGILPLLGTEQCSVQVSSALTRGYLYAASAPISIFGSLGVVSAGFKTFGACFTFGSIEGAKVLGDMGFEPQGENLSLIMVEAGKGRERRYVIETRMDEMIKEFNIDKDRITGVSHKTTAWNFKMAATAAVLSGLSITPYIYLNLGANTLNKTTTWVFPVLRSSGGFITATFIQLLIQRRISTLSDQYIKRGRLPPPNRDNLPNRDVEADDETKKHQMDAWTWLLLCLLLIGLLASVVGYVGCFSVVQNSTSTFGPVSWLCLEVGLSLMRLAIWAWNPTGDDAPSLKINLELDNYNPLPTCNKDNEEILQYKVLPLTRAREFLKIITSFVGLIQPFSHPDLSLYYTLTWKRPSKKSAPADIDTQPKNTDQHVLGERALYITVFDHKERTTRVYTRDNGIDTFYSTESKAPLVDVGRFLLEVVIDAKIDPEGDPVSSDSSNLASLRNHHQSILEHIQYRQSILEHIQYRDYRPYAIENSWTMKAEDTVSTVQRLRKDVWERGVEKGKEAERNETSLALCNYLVHPRRQQLLYEKRVEWIKRRMEVTTKETKERFEVDKDVEYRVDKQAAENKPTKLHEEVEELLCQERYLMELLLLYEVKEWEERFWKEIEAFLRQRGMREKERLMRQRRADWEEIEAFLLQRDKREKERLMRVWRADCRKRLGLQKDAAVKRMAKSAKFGERLGEWWASSISQLLKGVEKPNSISLSDELREEMKLLDDEIRLRAEEEIKDAEFRLELGSDFEQFWDDASLFECRYSQSKWLLLKPHSTLPHEIYSRALKGNENIVHITLNGSNSDFIWFEATIRDLPSVTSISCDLFSLSDSVPGRHDPLFIKSYYKNNLITFTEEIRLKLDSFSTYIFTDAGGSDMYSLPDRLGKTLGNNARVLISFVAPTSGQNLILRLKHFSSEDAPLHVILGSNIIQINPSTKSITIDDITLCPIQDHGPSKSDLLSFTPEIRNDIVIALVRSSGDRHTILHDIELLDEAGLKYPK